MIHPFNCALNSSTSRFTLLILVSAEEQFEHDIPELANQMSEAEKNIGQLKNSITTLNYSIPTQTETDAQISINELQR